jgi:hypothetical protein
MSRVKGMQQKRWLILGGSYFQGRHITVLCQLWMARRIELIRLTRNAFATDHPIAGTPEDSCSGFIRQTSLLALLKKHTIPLSLNIGCWPISADCTRR